MKTAASIAVLAAFDGHMGTGWGVLLVVAMVTMMGGMGWMMWSMTRGRGDHRGQECEDAVQILKTRYARGELTTEEYQERLAQIDRDER